MSICFKASDGWRIQRIGYLGEARVAHQQGVAVALSEPTLRSELPKYLKTLQCACVRSGPRRGAWCTVGDRGCAETLRYYL